MAKFNWGDLNTEQTKEELANGFAMLQTHEIIAVLIEYYEEDEDSMLEVATQLQEMYDEIIANKEEEE